ncbi:MAG TPA: RNA methyltransferase [Solirubrobacteraceae bacterium]|nr:RNA methyltransferase [Solirubrobacteraceae bacterium]
MRAARLLRDAGARRDEGAFAVDGAELLREAVAAGIEVEVVLAADPREAEAALGGEPAEGPAPAPGAAIVAAAPDALRALAALGQPPRLVAICRTPPPPPPGVPPRSLVLARVAGAGNVGSIVRTAAALGLPRVALTPGCADPWSRRALRAAMGATFARGLVATERPLGGARGPLAAAVPRGGLDPRDLPADASVVLGSEADGLSDAERRACDLAVTIPAHGFESLNVAAAAAILAWELARRAQGRA